MIIAITGLKRSGKNTISKYIHDNYKFTEYAFARPIKLVSYLLFGWNEDDDETLKEIIDENWGISRRQFWQWLGTDAFQKSLPDTYPLFKQTVGRNFWVKIFDSIYKKNKKDYVISDFRFPHEKEYLESKNAITIQAINPNLNICDNHESEMYIRDLETDFIIINDGTLEELYQKIDEIMKQIHKEE
ncbi:MAG TPA: hypothetical protein PKI46_04565 [Bacteroidales bacterium]|nr:hypothetical protein [Bacteroidales bacterium]